jgi:predicted nucleotidyltransferase
METVAIDVDTARAAQVFLDRISGRYAVSEAFLFGSRARRTHRSDSDADIAVVIGGAHGKRSDAAVDMAGVAFDVLLETGVLIEALPLWQDELDHPERFSNPALIESIRREGVKL